MGKSSSVLKIDYVVDKNGKMYLYVMNGVKPRVYELGVQNSTDEVVYANSILTKYGNEGFYKYDLLSFAQTFSTVIVQNLLDYEGCLEIPYSLGVDVGTMAEYKPKHWAVETSASYDNVSYLSIYDSDEVYGFNSMCVFVKKAKLFDVLKIINETISILAINYDTKIDTYVEPCLGSNVKIDLDDEVYDFMRTDVLDELNRK